MLPAMSATLIDIRNLSLWYNKGKQNEVQALKNINLTIDRGEYVAFFGPSGCGKTTMLYTISGIDRYQEGKIFINNKDTSTFSSREASIFRQTGIGIVFQQFNLVPSLTVLQNVTLPMSFLGISREKAEKEAKALLERLNLLPYADRFPKELSGGQQQRVGIARALANNPPIIIADEPLGNLDSVNAKNVMEFLKELNEKDGRTIIMVTHEAWSLRDAQRVFYMKDGTITRVTNQKELGDDAISKHLSEQLDSQNKEELSARIISNFLMKGYSVTETKRFEEATRARLSGEIDSLAYKNILDQPFRDNGVGLWSQKAERVSNYVESIMNIQHDIGAIRETLEKSPELSINDEVRRIRQWLLEETFGDFSDFQISALEEIISDRIRGHINNEQFRSLLDRPEKILGAGFSFRTAQKLAERFETLLSVPTRIIPSSA